MIRLLLALGFIGLMTLPSRGEESPHLRVRVTLKNGARMEGVVRDGSLYEVMGADGGFRPGRGARSGFRLYYVTDSPGYLFVEHGSVRNFEQISLMSNKEVYEIEKGLRDRASIIVLPYRKKTEEELALEEAALMESESPMEEEVGEESGDELDRTEGPAEKEEPKEAAELSAAERLLRQFPPEEGWLPERREEIERRKWVLGIYPTPREKLFLEEFPVWKEGYDEWLRKLIGKKADEERRRLDAQEERRDKIRVNTDFPQG